MSPQHIILILLLILAAVALLLALAMLIGRWLAASARGLEYPDDDGETM